jgi:hypothetical protein
MSSKVEFGKSNFKRVYFLSANQCVIRVLETVGLIIFVLVGKC